MFILYSVVWNLIFCIRNGKKELLCLNHIYTLWTSSSFISFFKKKLSAFWCNLCFIRKSLLYQEDYEHIFCDKGLKEMELSTKSELTGLNNYKEHQEFSPAYRLLYLDAKKTMSIFSVIKA